MLLMTESPSWLWFASAISLVAALGGLVVLRGLWLEGLSRPETFENVEAQRTHHKREAKGIKWVFAGVAIEVIVAFGMTFKEGWEAHKTEIELADIQQKVKWRTIAPEQKKSFIELTRGRLKFPIWVRYSNPTPEVEGFAAKIRQMLDEAGFGETNSEKALARWPSDLSVAWNGEGETGSVAFVSNIRTSGQIFDLQDVQKVLLNYSNAQKFTKTMFLFTNADIVTPPFLIFTNGEPILVLSIDNRGISKQNTFNQMANDFGAIGIRPAWVTTTNIPEGACEVFVIPKF